MMMSLAKYILTFNTFNWMFQTSVSSSRKSSFFLPGQPGMWKRDCQTQFGNHFFITTFNAPNISLSCLSLLKFQAKMTSKKTSGTFSSSRPEGKGLSMNKEWPFLLPTTPRGASPPHLLLKAQINLSPTTILPPCADPEVLKPTSPQLRCYS